MSPSALLSELAAVGNGRVVGLAEVEVTDVQHDSRGLEPGHLFVAVRGLTNDGHVFVEDAERLGAAAVCVEEESAQLGIPQLVVANTREALGPLAAAVHGHPSHDVAVVGVTGTNGKTTVTHFLEAIVDSAGLAAGLIGTLGARIKGRPLPLARTTPEASDFQRVLRLMLDSGVEVAAAEISSHALSLHRVDGTDFRIAAFTNLSQDHLDFHADMEHYFAAKASLFSLGPPDHAVVWTEDEWGRRLVRDHTRGIDLTTVGLSPQCNVFATDVEYDVDGSRFSLVTPTSKSDVTLQLPGDFNIENALTAAACAYVLGIDMSAIVEGLEAVSSVPGRFERVTRPGDEPQVIVDYAHAPAGVEAVIAAARRIGDRKLIAVVGAAGDRDREKRPMMGAAAAAADVVIVTSDNPRSEPPSSVTDAVREGAEAAGHGDVTVIVDRRQAIRNALERGTAGDIVLVLGRGAESHQEIGGEFLPFDDRVVVREELAGL